jgi:hypothetical protein
MTFPPLPVTMGAMDTSSADWITIAAYENLPGFLRPMAAARA